MNNNYMEGITLIIFLVMTYVFLHIVISREIANSYILVMILINVIALRMESGKL